MMIFFIYISKFLQNLPSLKLLKEVGSDTLSKWAFAVDGDQRSNHEMVMVHHYGDILRKMGEIENIMRVIELSPYHCQLIT